MLNSEQEWIDLETMTEFCFSEERTSDHESAVVRAFFEDKLYFKFTVDGFFPYTEEQVEQLKAKAREEARKERIVERGGDWISGVLKHLENGDKTVGGHSPGLSPKLSEDEREYAEILKGYYLFEKESRHHDLAKGMMAKAGLKDIDRELSIVDILIAAGIWAPDENVDLHRFEIPTEFSDAAREYEAGLRREPSARFEVGAPRQDLTGRRAITIDGEATLDFDDALTIEPKEDHFRLDVHIADVAEVVRRDSAVDRDARERGTSIYMPDQKIPMIPPGLAEGLCSLKAGEIRPTITTSIRIRKDGTILGHEIFPSCIKVTDQLTYTSVNEMVDDQPDIAALTRIARAFRDRRLDDGAMHIALPEVNLWFDDNNELVFNRVAREGTSRMLVAELMIMANWLMARFLSERRLPAVFRSQPAPKERLFQGEKGSLFQNWMQRKLLNRFILSPEPEPHAGLGLDRYLTATSPIRRYFDLVTQRQVRSAFGLEPAYTGEEIEKVIQVMEQPMMHAGRLQFRRKKYWLLKYLETQIGRETQAIVLNKRRNGYQVLLTEYMIETTLPVSGGIELKPEDMVCVTIQHADARKDLIAVFMS